MDDRRLPILSCPRIVRTSEFSRLGKSLLASAYERVLPIACAVIPVNTSSRSGTSRRALPDAPIRKVGS